MLRAQKALVLYILLFLFQFTLVVKAGTHGQSRLLAPLRAQPPSMGWLLPGGHGSLPGGQVHITKNSLGTLDYSINCSLQVYILGRSVFTEPVSGRWPESMIQ